jgi:hypothetical protein
MHRRLPELLRRFWAWSVVAFVLTLVVAWVEFHAGLPEGRWNPMAFPFFGDLMEYPGTYQWLHTSVFFFNLSARPIPYPLYSAVAYPPFSAVVMVGIYSAASPIMRFLELSAIWLAIALWGVRRRLMSYGIAGTTATLFPLTLALVSFPLVRLVYQGNIEMVLWIFTVLGVWLYLRGYDDAAAVLWGLAAAMKLYPIILLILLLPKRRWRAFALGVAVFVGVTVLSLWWLGPTMGVAWRGSIQNVFGYQGMRASEWSLRELMANHSVFELAKVVAVCAGLPLARLTLPYYACGAVVMGWAFFRRLWTMPVANQLLAVSVFMVMFPPISYYHALVHLYAPLLVLLFLAIRAERAGGQVPGLQRTVLLFVPLFCSFTLFTFPHAMLFCGLVQACLLIALFVCALQFPFAEPEILPTTAALSEADEVGALRAERL